MRILVLNAGSSSMKLRLLDSHDEVVLSRDLGTEGLKTPGALEEAVGEDASRRSAEMIGRSLDSLRIVTCHLGAGASLAAVAEGRSVDTTMGLTPLEGLVMATRSGSIDPSIHLWLQAHAGDDRGIPPIRVEGLSQGPLRGARTGIRYKHPVPRRGRDDWGYK